MTFLVPALSDLLYDMNYYEATHERSFSDKNYRGTKNILVTAKSKLASLVNTSWIYSSHWPENEGWVNKAKEDITHELQLARARVKELEQAKAIVDSIVMPDI